MVHNGIEYGIMQAYAEGFDIFKTGHFQKSFREELRFEAKAWGILPRSLAARQRYPAPGCSISPPWRCCSKRPDLASYSGFVQDSGEGRWTVQAAVEQAVPAEVLTSALYTRFRSRQQHTFAEKILSAMRKKFGGHVERPTGG